MTTATYTVLGTSDDATECALCGRTELKRVVRMRHNESGEECFFGTTCAAKAAGWGPGQAKAELDKAWRLQLEIDAEQREQRVHAWILKHSPIAVQTNARGRILNIVQIAEAMGHDRFWSETQRVRMGLCGN